MARWATTTDRIALNADQVTLLMLMIHEKIEEGSPFDEPGREHRATWEHIGSQIEILGRYHVCCACLALVHEEDREAHPCGPCTCSQPLVVDLDRLAARVEPGEGVRDGLPDRAGV